MNLHEKRKASLFQFSKAGGKWILLFILCFFTMSSFGQENAISGKISDVDGTPIPGVNIVIKGTTTGTVTDLDGNFTLNIDGDQATIVISAMGYNSQELSVQKGQELTVSLEEELTELGEVVVIGYGVQKKALVTGAISSIGAEDIANRPITRAEQALQGQTAGVYVLPTSGSPGASMSVRVRGAGTNGNANPLYIVDGIKHTDINHLEPGDIESMQVLKDAASSAIYGAEGGNGVVIITTKKGKSGEGTVTYDYQAGIQSPGKLAELMDAQEYAQYMSDGGYVSVDPTQITGSGTDWLDEIFEDAPMQKHRLSFSGGDEKSHFMASGSYLNQDGILGGDKANFKRYTGRLNMDRDVKKWLTVGANISYSGTKRASIQEDSEFDGVLSSALLIDPLTEPIYEDAIPDHVQDLIDEGNPIKPNSDGKYYGISEYTSGEAINPLLRLDISKGDTKQDKLFANSYIDIKPMKDLKITSRISIDYMHSNYHTWFPTYYYSSERNNSNTAMRDQSFTNKKWIWENFVTYSKKFENHNLNIVAGVSTESLTYKKLNGTSQEMLREEDIFSEHDYKTESNTGVVEGNYYEERILSLFGRASYDYLGKYMLQGTLRRDGASSSLVHPDGSWGIFPSVSGGWVISEEDFYTSELISFVKLRASWGQNGSLSNLRSPWTAYNEFNMFNGVDHFLYTSTLTSEGIRYPLPDGTYITGTEPFVLENTDLTWETSQQTDIGLDVRAWEGRISVGLDYYVKTTKNILLRYDMPAIAGNNSPFINSGDVQNKGLEFNIGVRNNEGAVKWNANFNISTLKNEVTKLDASVPIIYGMRVGSSWLDATAFEKGEPIWYYHGYKTDGVFDDQADVDSYVAAKGIAVNADYSPQPGDLKIIDVNGDGAITEEDKTNIGSPQPSLLYGASLGLEFNFGVDVNIFLQGVSGNEILMGWLRDDRMYYNKPKYLNEDRWTTDNPTGSMPSANADARTWQSDILVHDGAYLRVKQIQVGYSFPTAFLERIRISKVRVYISIDDYFTFTKYKGMDPEAGSDQNVSLGIDRGVYPIAKKVMGGLSVTF